MRWTLEQARVWQQTRPWRCGFNFLPSTAVNATEMWQRESFDLPTMERELGWAQKIGFNACRVFLPFLVWQDDPQGFAERLDQFLNAANQHGLSTLPILFDDCAFAGREPYLGPQAAPVPGVHNSGWTASPGRSRVLNQSDWPQLQEYVTSILSCFGSDPRILAWDLHNEPGNDNMGEQSLPLLEAVFQWARQANPAQPLTVGVWNDSPAFDRLNAVSLQQSDILSFHLYADLPQTQARVAELRSLGRPLLCTEWMGRTLKSRYETHLPFFKQENVGCFAWGLVNGKTQTHLPWGSRPGDSAPPVWFHDLLDRKGKPYSETEVDVILQMQK